MSFWKTVFASMTAIIVYMAGFRLIQFLLQKFSPAKKNSDIAGGAQPAAAVPAARPAESRGAEAVRRSSKTELGPPPVMTEPRYQSELVY